jgi:glycosyltransferase involved in cell wall biosynthesis
MKVLQINTVANSGSTGRIAEEIGNVLMANGHQSYIAYGRNNATSSSQLIKIGNKWDNYIHGIYTLLTDKHAFVSTKATKKLISKIDRIKPDLIALHNLHGYYINISILFKYLQKRNIPVIWTLFDCWAFTGHCTYFDDINCEKWKTHCYNCPKHLKYPKSLVDNSSFNFRQKKDLFSSIDHLELITHSKWLSKLVKKSFLSDYKVHVTPSAINLDLFKPIASNLEIRFNLSGKKVVLGVASTWDKRKGLNDFVKLSKVLDSSFQIVLIGLSKQQIGSLPDNIIGLNRTESIQELAQWYSLANVFINLTTQDNFPTTNIEALACGTPVITYNTGGSPEAIDLQTGCVVNKRNIDGVIRAVKELEDKGQILLSKACRARAVKFYDKTTRYQDYIKIFENMINKNKTI